MIIIGEKCNGQFRLVGKAIDERDESILQDLAIRQVKRGAHKLDVSVGAGREDAPDAMKWAVEAIQNVVDIGLSIDTQDLETMEAGLKSCKRKAMINSTTAESKKMDAMFSLAQEYESDIICLTMNEKGVPLDATSRVELAMIILQKAMDFDISSERIYLDPLVMQISSAQKQSLEVLEALKLFRNLSDPPPNTVVGLSNLSSGAEERSLLNATYLAMLMSCGLTAAILDPEDELVMKVLRTSQILLNQKLYAPSYLKA